MEPGDIANELSSSSIVEDDLNGVFNSLEPLEDPKDDMFFFGGKDHLQKVRIKNPANNNNSPAHKPNIPSRPPPLPSNMLLSSPHISGLPSTSHTSLLRELNSPKSHAADKYSINDSNVNSTSSTYHPQHDKPGILKARHHQAPQHKRASSKLVHKNKAGSYIVQPVTQSNNLPNGSGEIQQLTSNFININLPGTTGPSNPSTFLPAPMLSNISNTSTNNFAIPMSASKRGRTFVKVPNESKPRRVAHRNMNDTPPPFSNDIEITPEANNSNNMTDTANNEYIENSSQIGSIPDRNPDNYRNLNNRNDAVFPNAGTNSVAMPNVGYAPLYYYGYPTQPVFLPHPQMMYSAPLPNQELMYNTTSRNGNLETQSVSPNPSNDLYSNLYLYSFNNNNNNSTNLSNSTKRTPAQENATSYNTYNNVYMNNAYTLYGNNNSERSLPSPKSHRYGNDSHKHRRKHTHDDEDYMEDDDLPRSKSHHHARRSKRRSDDDDDDFRKPSRKSKKEIRKKPKLPLTIADVFEQEQKETSATLTASADPIGKQSAPATPPRSPFGKAKRAKSRANLFENTPKIKIGEVRGGDVKICQLGKKLLEVANLDCGDNSIFRNTTSATSSRPNQEGIIEDASQVPATSSFQNDTGSPQETTNDASTATKHSIEEVPIFIEYNSVPERKTELLYFIASNIEALMTMPTKIDITLNDFKASLMGTKVKQRLDVMMTIKKANELGLIKESQFSEKQAQFLDAFTFGMGRREKPAANTPNREDTK